jgi:pimeloyl-ACP methyl ester carboxylesterase
MLFKSQGVKVGYDVVGEGETTLALFHAYPLSRGQWRAQAEALATQFVLRVVTPDLTGCGESSDRADVITMERMASDARALFDELARGRADQRVILGGVSLGGYVSLAAMRLYPERVAGLILGDTRASADTPEGKVSREATAAFVLNSGAAALFNRDAPRLLSNRALTREPDLVAYVRSLAEVNQAGGLAAVARGMGQRPDSTQLLPNITCPTLVLVGEQDVITPIADARLLFERIPHAELAVITDAGHLANLEQPAAVTQRIAMFLREQLNVPDRA